MAWRLSQTRISEALTFNTLGKGEAKINLQTKLPSLTQKASGEIICGCYGSLDKSNQSCPLSTSLAQQAMNLEVSLRKVQLEPVLTESWFQDYWHMHKITVIK